MSVPGPEALSADDSGESSAIADLSYRTYDGPLKTHTVRWWIVAVATLRRNINKQRFGYWIPAALVFLIYLFWGILFYVSQNVRQNLQNAGGPAGALEINFYTFVLYQSLVGAGILLFAATLTVGSGAIADDNRANALLVYLSKPITRADYLLGKWIGVFFLLAVVSLAPALFLYLFFLTAYTSDGFLRDNPTLILRLIVATLVPCALHASLMLGFSAWSRSPRMAGAIYAAFYFVIGILSGIGGTILTLQGSALPGANIVRYVSVKGVSDGIAMHLYDITPDQVLQGLQAGGRRRGRRSRPTAKPNASAETPPEPPADSGPPDESGPPAGLIGERPPLGPLILIAGVYIVVPVLLAIRRVRAVEVVRG